MPEGASPAPQEQGRSSLRVAVIGAGRWGRNLVRTFGTLEEAELVAICDSNPSRLAAAGSPLRSSTDHRDLLRDRDLDAVVVATPPDTLAAITVAALDAGKHVFVEKPMALRVEDALRVSRAAKANGRRVMVGLLLLYHPAILQLKGWLDRGFLGDVTHIAARRHGAPRGLRDPGPWWSLAPHDVSLARYLLGEDPTDIVAVSETTGRATRVRARLTFPRGCVAELSAQDGTDVKERRLVVVGTRATAVFEDGPGGGSLDLVTSSGDEAPDLRRALETRHEPAFAVIEPLRAEALHFVRSLRDGTPFRTDIEEALRVVEILARGEEQMTLRRGLGPAYADATGHDFASPAGSCIP
jgi:UDP-2-acetamido-3-amino-2,3-dideoxy-glucuronate N-acetyltransferase